MKVEVPSSSDFKETETGLWRAWTQDQDWDARERIFALHYEFALQTAKRHHFDWTGTDLELTDLRQAAYVGLLEAIDHYDPKRGVPFRAYARARVRGSVLDAAAKASEVREQIAARGRLRQDRFNSLRSTQNRTEEISALDQLMDMAIGLAIGFMLEGSNLYQTEDTADTAPNGYDSLVWRETMQQLGDEVWALPEKERIVLKHHYGGDLSFEQIGALLGVTRARISQIHKDAIGRLRQSFARKRLMALKL